MGLTVRGSPKILFILLTTPTLLAVPFAGAQTALASSEIHGERSQHTAPAATSAFYCTDPQRVSTVQGNPHVTSVPPLESVSLVPVFGGLTVSFRFRKPLVLAPEGVYISWTVYIYRHRSDASSYEQGVQLEFQDRGKGWEPSGWTILASTYTDDKPISGDVHMDQARDELSTFFPPGFFNLNPPFYWFAGQEEYRAYLPSSNKAAPQDWAVNGAVFTDCPDGVRQGPNSLPYEKKLLVASG
jgi:hypothetical protein